VVWETPGITGSVEMYEDKMIDDVEVTPPIGCETLTESAVPVHREFNDQVSKTTPFGAML